MLAILVLSALIGLALGDPLPPVKKHTEIIHVPAPKPVVRKVPALQEHARIQVQHVPIRQTVVKQVNVPRDIVREVPVIVEKKLILKQPQIRRFPIDVQKTLLQPHIKHVPQVRVNYRKRPYDVWHTKEVKKIINVPRPVPVIKHKIITKVLNRIVDVPHKVYKDRVKVVQVPQPFKVQKVHHRKVDVPIEVRVPVPRVHIKQTHEVQKVPIDVTVVKKVAIPRKTTLTEIVPVPVKTEGCGPDGVNCGSVASVSSVVGGNVGLASVVQRQDVVVNRGPGSVITDTVYRGEPGRDFRGEPGRDFIGAAGFREDVRDVGFGGPGGAAVVDTFDAHVGATGGAEYGDAILSVGPDGGPGVGLGVGAGTSATLVDTQVVGGPGLGPGTGGDIYSPDGPGFDTGFDGTGFDQSATFVNSGIGPGGPGISLRELALRDGLADIDVTGAGIGPGGGRSDLVSIRHTERVVPVPLPGGGYRESYQESYLGGQGDYGHDVYGTDVYGPPLDGQSGFDYDLSAASAVGGGSGYEGGVDGGFDYVAAGGGGGNGGSGYRGGVAGGFDYVAAGGGGGGNGRSFYEETRSTLPLQVTGTVRGEYRPPKEVDITNM